MVKIVLNIEKRHAYLIVGVLTFLIGLFFVVAWQTNNPSSFGHSIGEMDWSQSISKLKLDKLQIGAKWLLSGVGDAHGNDAWLRLFDINGNGYYGGLAADYLWAGNTLYANNQLCLRGDCRTGWPVDTDTRGSLQCTYRRLTTGGGLRTADQICADYGEVCVSVKELYGNAKMCTDTMNNIYDFMRCCKVV